MIWLVSFPDLLWGENKGMAHQLTRKWSQGWNAGASVKHVLVLSLAIAHHFRSRDADMAAS